MNFEAPPSDEDPIEEHQFTYVQMPALFPADSISWIESYRAKVRPRDKTGLRMDVPFDQRTTTYKVTVHLKDGQAIPIWMSPERHYQLTKAFENYIKV